MVHKSTPFTVLNGDLPGSFMFSPIEIPGPTMLLNLSPTIAGDVNMTSESIDFKGSQQHFDGFSIGSPQDVQGNIRTISFPFSLPDAWKPNLPWDSSLLS